MNEKVENALNETRILVLVVQVLIGFQFQAVFTKGFDRMAHSGQIAVLVGGGLLLTAMSLLLMPAPYHQIVDRGDRSMRLCRVTTAVVGVALVLLSTALGLQFAVIAARVLGSAAALACGIALSALALTFLWGIQLVERWRRGRTDDGCTKPEDDEMKTEESSLPEKIKFALTETRVVLPGAQALLGFQFACILTEQFASMPEPLKRAHLISLVAIAMSAVFLMAPAAYHRIVESGESTEAMYRFSGNMLLAAMVMLGLGISVDVYVVVDKVVGSAGMALTSAIASLVFGYSVWFGYTAAVRSRQHPIVLGPTGQPVR